MQIRSGQANEQVFAKRLIDGFRKDAVTVGLRPYDGTYSFQQLETYLYSWVSTRLFNSFNQIKIAAITTFLDQLRIVQGGRTLLPLVDSSEDNNSIGLYGDETETIASVDKCTHTTQRCPHAMYAYTTLPPACYTGVPCAAYSKNNFISNIQNHCISIITDGKCHWTVPYHRHHKPVGSKTAENGRVILPKLNVNNNNNNSQNKTKRDNWRRHPLRRITHILYIPCYHIVILTPCYKH